MSDIRSKRKNWNSRPPQLYLIADSPNFDCTTVNDWKDEGYNVSYIFFNGNKKELLNQVDHLADALEPQEKYAIVAYAKAASVILEMCINPMPRLCTLVSYYPTKLPAMTPDFSNNLNIAVHLTGSTSEAPRFKSYTYPYAQDGFAEADLETYEKISASLAWSRSLALVRKGFGIEVDLEGAWEEHLALEFETKDAEATMRTMVDQPYVNHIPTLTGGTGFQDLLRFYSEFFIPNNPPSMKMRLLSRTIGTDRVVDEMHVYFRHTQEIPWLLPGLEPTDKEVEFILVSIVCIRGGKLYHEHIHWDQATILFQIGLLDPKIAKGFRRLPVVGVEGARKVMDETSVESNGFLRDW